MIWLAALDGNCFFLSKRWEEYTGIAAAEQVGSRWTTQLHEEDRPLVRAAWESAVKTGTDFQLYCRIRRFDGMYRWFETRGMPLRDPQGHIVSWFGTNTDVHDAHEARRQVAEQEERLRYVALATHDAIYDFDIRTITSAFAKAPTLRSMLSYPHVARNIDCSNPTAVTRLLRTVLTYCMTRTKSRSD
jgi:PAS domain S-box-containing protein